MVTNKPPNDEKLALSDAHCSEITYLNILQIRCHQFVVYGIMEVKFSFQAVSFNYLIPTFW